MTSLSDTQRWIAKKNEELIKERGIDWIVEKLKESGEDEIAKILATSVVHYDLPLDILPIEVYLDYKFKGLDNYKNPRRNYVHKVFAMTKMELLAFTADAIYWSAWANNNPRSDYHWHVDACYWACLQFDGLYQEAYDRARGRC